MFYGVPNLLTLVNGIESPFDQFCAIKLKLQNMMRTIFILVIYSIANLTLIGQDVTQLIRGTIIDGDTQTPLIGATIVVVPNAWLAWRLADGEPAHESDVSPKQIRKERREERREVTKEGPARILALSLTKFLTTAGAAALALAVLKPALAGFFAGLVVTVLTAALVPPFLAPQQLARAPRLD